MQQLVPIFFVNKIKSNFEEFSSSLTTSTKLIFHYIKEVANSTEYITLLNSKLTYYCIITTPVLLLLTILIFLAMAMGQGTKTKTDYDNIVTIGIAFAVFFLLTAAFSARDVVVIILGSEPLYSEPGFTEILRVFFSRTYDLHIISTIIPDTHIIIPNMPGAFHSFTDATGHPALQQLVYNFLDLHHMLVQLDISFHNRMGAPETYRDELELNKLKAVLNLIYKIQAIIIYYIPSFPGLDLAEFA